ncbi:hypothetical protein J132_01964 [Termitomyces sp. J132]|nr:hypothetical protein J132_01964 [Termitomyces sp. J132]
MPQLDPNPPDFKLTRRYTAECKEIIDQVHDDGFLWPEEMKAVHHLMMLHNEAFVWDESQRGRLKEEFLPSVVIIPHTLWVSKNIPIAPGLRDEICQMIKQKIEAEVYEPSTLHTDPSVNSRKSQFLPEGPLSTEELIGYHARALAKHHQHMEEMRK